MTAAEISASPPLRPRLLMMMAMALLLAGCAEASTAGRPGAPLNGAGQPVDPVYGTSVPGTPMTTGGGGGM